MNAQQTGRIAGIFLLLMVAVGIPSVLFRGIDSSLTSSPDFLTTTVEGAKGMKFSILLSFLASIFGLAFTITIYPILNRHRTYLANAMVALWVFQMSVSLVGDICVYMMIEMAQWTSSHGEGLDTFLPMGTMMAKGYMGAHFLGLLGYSGAFVFMNAHLLKFKLVASWMAVWGMVATGLVFTATVLQILDQSVSFYFYGQNGLYMSSFASYMLWKGFKET